MRHLAFLLLLTGCRVSPSPVKIPDLLAQDPIDVDRLEEALFIEPGTLRIIPPSMPTISFKPTPGPWFIVNEGSRPIRINKSEVRVKVEFTPIVPDGLPRMFGRLTQTYSLDRPPRPTFTPSDWVLLEPGERLEVWADVEKPVDRWFGRKRVTPKRPVDRIPGLYRYGLSVPRSGEELCWKARDFNDWKPLKHPLALPDLVRSHSIEEQVFPRFDSPGSPWHGRNSIA